jgi:hypothetical protein
MRATDPRLPFDEAKSAFVTFLESQHWPTDLLWLSRDRITSHRNQFWLFRPFELKSDGSSRAFYEAARASASSIRLDAFCTLRHSTLAYVHDWGAESRCLNFGVPRTPPSPQIVNSRTLWALLQSVNAIRGESPFMQHTAIPPTT